MSEKWHFNEIFIIFNASDVFLLMLLQITKDRPNKARLWESIFTSEQNEKNFITF